MADEKITRLPTRWRKIADEKIKRGRKSLVDAIEALDRGNVTEASARAQKAAAHFEAAHAFGYVDRYHTRHAPDEPLD